MTRTVDGSLTTPEKTPSQRTLRVLPCPTHTVGHPAFVVSQLSQLSPISPSVAHLRHQNQTSNAHASHSPSDRGSRQARSQETSQGQGGLHMNAYDETFQLELWNLVPSAFRPQRKGQGVTFRSTLLQQRPTTLDTIDHSDSSPHTPQNSRQHYGSNCSSETEGSPAKNASPGSLSKKRRYSNPSPMVTSKRTNITRQRSKKLADPTQSHPKTKTTDKNPFEVDQGQDSEIELLLFDRNGSGSTSRRQHHPHHATGVHYKSQQTPKTSRTLDPISPPTPRYRRRSLEPDMIFGQSPTRIDDSPSASLQKRMHFRFSGSPGPADMNFGYDVRSKEPRMLIAESPTDTLVRTNAGHFSTNVHNSEPPSPRSQDTEILRTPTKPAVRRLSMSSLSTKSPPSAPSSILRSPHPRRRSTQPGSPSVSASSGIMKRASHPTSPSENLIDIEPLADSPLRRIEWSPSLETPGKPRKVPIDNMIRRLRGLPLMASTDGLSQQPMELVDWSASLETPPRKATSNKGLVSEPYAHKAVIEKLRGVPPNNPMSETIGESAPSSQDGSFYSASSSLADGDNKNQRNCKFRGGGNSSITDYSQDGAGVGMTLPSSLVDRLEQDSPVMGDLEIQSQILPDSQGDIFDGISNSAIAKGLLSRSNESLQQISQLLSPKLERLSGIGDGLHGELHLHSGNVARSISGPVGPQSAVDGRASNNAIAPVAGVLEPRRTLTSEDSDAENLQLEHWGVFSPILEDQDANMSNKQWRQDDSRGQDQNPIEVNSDDDFGNIRFSQLDDGFNIIPEASQGSHASQTIIKVEKTDDRVDETAWLSTSAAMLGDIDMRHEPADFIDTKRAQPGPLFIGGGFSSASGKKLAPLSRAALARVANLFDSDDDPGFGASTDRIPHMIDMATQAAAPKVFGGFSTAGKKPLPPISKAARDRAALLFEDGDMDTAALASRPPESLASIAASTAREVVSGEFGGFTSGSGKKPMPVSKVALDKWSNQFSENDVSDSATRGVTESGVRQGPFTRPVPSISTIQPPEFAGFSSGTGKTLAPISKAAQERALSVLEIDEPFMVTSTNHKSSLKPALGSNRSSLSGASGFWPLIATAGGSAHQQPVLSSHMNNLKRKSLRSSSSHSSLPGIMKPLSKASVPFKPPLPFKSPLKIPSYTAAQSGTGSEVINAISDHKAGATNVLPSKHAVLVKKPTNKRTTLHPNARPAPTEVPNFPSAQPSKVALTPYKSLFSLEAEGAKGSLRETLGPPHQSSLEDLIDHEVPADAINMTLAKARVYRFNDWGVEEAYKDLITRGAKPYLMPKVWLSNHYALIVWKLASYVRTWPQYFHSESMSWFSPAKVLDQLSYRYEREINRAERPALRKIVEGDETAARHMVLCISSLMNEYSEEAKQDVWRVTVTDGWYILPAVLDSTLTRAVEKGKLKVGSKIHVCKVKISGVENGVAILELSDAGATSSSVTMALQSNSTKLARWDAKLGFQRTPMIWTTRLRNIYPDGGLVPGLDVIVLRKYPVVYLETLEDGVTKIKRNVRDEERVAEAHREQMQKRYEDMIQEVEKEFGMEANPARVQEEIQARASELQSEVLTRNVVPFFTIRVGNYLSGTGSDDRDDGVLHQEALVTFWHAGHEPYQEGHRVRLTSLAAKKSSREFGFEDLLQLTGTRTTMVREMLTDPESMLLTSYQPREITTCADVGHLYQGAEIDLAVMILAVGEAVTSSNRIYFVVTDASKQLLLVEHQVSVSGTSSTADENLSLPSFLKVHGGILMTNARFKIRDYKLGLDIVSSLQSYTHIIAASIPIATSAHSSAGSGAGVPGPRAASGWPAYAHSSLHRLNQLSLDRTGSGKSDGTREEGDSLLDLMAKANTVLARMHPSL